MKINVHPDLSVEVIAPLEIEKELIYKRITKRAGWIYKQLEFFKTFLPKNAERQYISGETHLYLGRQYRLKVVKAEKNSVKIILPYIYIYTSNPENQELKEKLLNKWYRKQAKKKIAIIADNLIKKLLKYEIQPPQITYRKMKSRWGSCTHINQRVIFNTDLVKAPSHCIEYVVMHELCHLKHRFHDKAFYNFLTLVLPDWEGRKRRLEMVRI